VRPDPGRDVPESLRGDVRMLTTLLGRAIEEHDGPELLATVEELRTACISLRGWPVPSRRERVEVLVRSMDLHTAERVTRAFTAFFQLVNLAEERHRVRSLRSAGSGKTPPAESVEAAVAELGTEAVVRHLSGLRIHPVLTAHPTEAKRRAIVETLWRIGELLEQLDQQRITTSEEQLLRRKLAEEVTALWHTAPVRRHRPEPLDEVRATLALFDQTIFSTAPNLYREVERCLDPQGSGMREPVIPPFLRWGTWVGGDRDGNPFVTAATTIEAVRIQADHALRGLEAAARRIARGLTASDGDVPASRALRRIETRDEQRLPRRAQELRRTLPDAPHRRAMVLVSDRLAATRAEDAAAYERPDDFLSDLRTIQRSLADGGAPRLAFGELQQLVWQGETFGFHLAEMEIRQHAAVHAQALRELVKEAAGDARALDEIATRPNVRRPRTRSPVARETLATFRAIAEIQRRYGIAACHRVIVSFTRSAADLAAVHALARLSEPDAPPIVDAVPLLESRKELNDAVQILDQTMTLPGVHTRVRHRGGRVEVMLGYSDSAKEVGVLGANLALYRAQRELASWARRRRLQLTIFHGRGGALGRGGGPTNRAILGQPPGSVDGRFKVTEQGEAAFQRYGNPAIAARHLEQLTNAVVRAPDIDRPDPADDFAAAVATMEHASIEAYVGLVSDRRMRAFFRRVTPFREVGALPIASRPVSRTGGNDLEAIRAIPWVFAWSQSRVNLTGWFGLGAGLRAVADGPGGMATLRRMVRRWPFFASFIENAELSLAKADRAIAEPYLARGRDEELATAILEELERTRDMVLAVAGHDRLLDCRPQLRSAIDLRNAYVDALSFLQLRFLDERPSRQVDRILQATISGVAAGLQNTG
jgi:phosphoenolpyruvate carboxylase